MEAEDLAGAKAAQHATLSGAAEAVRRIIHHLQVVVCGDLFDCLGVASAPPHVDTDDSSRARRDESFDLCWVDVVRGRIHVGEDRRDSLPLQGMGSRNKRVARHNNLAVHAECSRGDLDRCGGITHGQCMFDAKNLRNLLFELLHHRPVVRQPAAVKDVGDQPEQTLAVTDVGATDVQRIELHGMPKDAVSPARNEAPQEQSPRQHTRRNATARTGSFLRITTRRTIPESRDTC